MRRHKGIRADANVNGRAVEAMGLTSPHATPAGSFLNTVKRAASASASVTPAATAVETSSPATVAAGAAGALAGVDELAAGSTAATSTASTATGSTASTPADSTDPAATTAAGSTPSTITDSTSTSGAGSGSPGSSDPTTTGTTSAGGGSQLVWSDDFTGGAGSAPDATKWTVAANWAGGIGQLQTYQDDPSNVSLDGAGDLAITTSYQPTSVDGVEYPFTSGMIMTKGLYSVAYGSIQARIKLPAGDGVWPAFWAVGANDDQVGWPNCGEIDMMENSGSAPNVLWGSLHGPNGSPDGYSLNNMKTSPTALSDAFHTYGVNWSPTEIQFTLDGQVYATETKAELGAGWVFDHPFYLILNTAVSAQALGSASPTAQMNASEFPATMLVDWVRVDENQ